MAVKLKIPKAKAPKTTYSGGGPVRVGGGVKLSGGVKTPAVIGTGAVTKAKDGTQPFTTQAAQNESNAPYFAQYYLSHPELKAPPGTPGVSQPQGAASGPSGSPGEAPQGVSALNPMDPATETAISERQKALQTALAAIAGEKQRAQIEFFDPANPMSRQAALKRQFNQVRSAQHINQGGLQLYSGGSATENALTDRDEGFGEVDLKRQYDDIISGLSAREQTERTNAANEIFGMQAAVRQAYGADPENTPVGTHDLPAQAEAAPVGVTLEQLMAAINMPGGATAAESQTPAATQPTTPSAGGKPKKGYTHVQTTGPRKGLSYNIVNGVKVYENGERMKVTS